MVGRKYEAGGIAKDGAKMVMAVANADVSTLTALLISGVQFVRFCLSQGWSQDGDGGRKRGREYINC